ncbi:MAG: cytochrome c [Planctomycetota bacterium]
MLRWLACTAVLLGLLGLVPFFLIALSRGRTGPATRIAIVQDMGHQPKFRAQAENPLFADGRAMRLPVDGTIARGELNEDTRLSRGTENGQYVTRFPLAVTKERLLRGQERFDIYCAPCHGLAGYGNGMVAVRAAELAAQEQAQWVAPVSYHDDKLRNTAHGSLFNTISNGVRTMPPYGSKLSIEDRWAIVMYIRALQRSQNARLEDVPMEKREELK